ncbi:MAG: S8 family serine peptidase [Planctomycetota bacterium]|jgi:subtilisin family serine protease
MRRVTTVLLILVGILLVGSYHVRASQQEKPKVIRLSEQSQGPITFPKIDRKPKPSSWNRGEMKSLPKYDPDSDNPFQIDLRCRDLTKLDLSNSIDDLLYAAFDDRTVWPASDKMPHDFTWQKIMELGKNPGLGVRSLHKKGITGRGVRVAIIDQPLLVDHQEYVERVRLYEEIDLQGETDPAMHGAAVASIAVGKTLGVAPEAELYYIAQYNVDRAKGIPSFRTLAQGIHRMLEINEQLPKDNKIRVISIQRGWHPSEDGYEEITEAAQQAKEAGMLVISSSVDQVHGFRFQSVGRHPLANPDVFESYEPGLWWAKKFYDGVRWRDAVRLLVPAGSRTTASPCGIDEYFFCRQGGWSWAIPYIAGVYTLAAQVEPEITPERFWNLAIKTGRTIELEHEGEKHPLGPIIDPVRLIRSISDDVGTNQQALSKHTIVPGVGVGDYTLDMSKDDVLSKLGEPEAIRFGGDEVIRRGQKKYNLNDLPREYILSFRDVSFRFENDSIRFINVHSPLYKLGNGLGVGDSEQKIKQAFGEDFELEEAQGKEFRLYQAKGIGFEIHEKNRTVAEILVYRVVPDSAEAALVRKAAADGLIAYRLTTPDEFKAIAGQPIREWTASDDDEIYLKYPGIRATFFGKGIKTPHTLVNIWCEGRGIDIGGDRPLVLRHEGDLDKIGSFSGFSDVDLSRLDLSQKGDMLKTTTFDSLTVWPPSDRLPPNFDPVKLLEWGKNPGLGVRSLHREGITGKGVGIAIIDQPLLKDHVEYADRIKSYHAIEVEGVRIMGHGSPVCSVAVGKTCGVAPEASLHYYAVPPWKWGENRPWARTVEQIVERNQDLSSSEKVRVISISSGLFSKMDYFDQWKSAVKKAHKNGILVVTCGSHFLRYVTLERLAGTDPDNPNNYSFDSGVHALYVPAGNMSIASDRGKDVYTFDARGGNSWSAPYLAGLAVLAFQVHPEISPDRIVTLFQETATQTKRGRVINPRGFIEAVKGL